MSQKRMAELYNVDVRTVSYHLTQIFESGELEESATIRKIEIDYYKRYAYIIIYTNQSSSLQRETFE